LTLSKKNIQQLSLLGVTVFLLVTLTIIGFNKKTAIYDKPINSQETHSDSKADIFALLERFSGSDEKLNGLISKLKTDSLNLANIKELETIGIVNKTEIFVAYSRYIQGIIENDDSLLQQSADLFFEAGTHDPDTLAEKTTYSIYSVRACDLILKNNPKDMAALTRKATCLVYFNGAVMEGVGLLKEVETLDSNYVQAQHHLLLLALQSGQYEKAKKRLKKLLHLQPDNQQYVDIMTKLETQH